MEAAVGAFIVSGSDIGLMEIEYLRYIIIIRFVQQPARMKRIKRQQESRARPAPPFAVEEIYNQKIVYRHPNDLVNILRQIPTQHFSPALTPAQKLRIAALIGFCHPVMNKETQAVIEKLVGSSSYWRLDANLTLMLEILNIVCLIPGLNYSSLQIKHIPRPHSDSYEEALWVNALPALLHGQHHLEVSDQVHKISKENALRVREFVNNILNLKQSVKQAVYESLDGPSGHFHDIDIQLAAEGILTTDYFPADYQAEYLQLWLDRTVELNTLLGNFVCKQKFGEFEYIRGPLLYAMQKGVLLVLNNFNQISNELLVSLKSLSYESKITLNQKTIRANAGFKILGIVSGERNNKSKTTIGKMISHFTLPSKGYEQIIPAFDNEQNRTFLLGLFKQNWKQLGYLGLLKLWKRIERLRRGIIQVEQEDEQQSRNNRLWGSFFTQDFIDSIDLELADLTNRPNNDRTISCQQKYRLTSIGRTEIAYTSQPLLKIVKTQYSLKVLEKLIVCFQLGEYPLLISETGCGKTTLVQYLAEMSGHKLFVYNMSSGTDVTDLIGGFKPIDCRVLLKELFMTFLEKFRQEVPGAQKNEAYLINLNNYFIQGKVELLLKSLIQSIPRIIQQLGSTASLYEWNEMLKKFTNIFSNLDKIDSNLVFSFLEGNLIKALRNGDWILIDEINLATNDVLQKIVPLIEGKSLMLYEKGDLNYIQRHKDFRIVACMNPANDSGKKPLPPNLGEKFTTILMSEPTKPDVEMMVKEICPQLNQYQISELFFNIKKTKTISLRNLSRALNYINKNKEVYGWSRCVYDGLMLGFGEKQSLKSFFNESIPKILPGTVEISGFLLTQGPFEQKTSQIFHLTDTFKSHLKDFLRAIAGTELPVLLQGPTSAGKTSMIRYVAETVGYKCIRINNHEHTEIQQYIGNYFPDKSGKLVFREGPLVQAVREGYWLILDQLNLAKTEILECLNRLLDDNRELFIPEQQKHIKPHRNFRIFATQNPSSYSGRKTLSRAFRNRFVSISFSDINTDDMMAILQARSPLLKDSKQLSSFVKRTLQSLINYRQRQRVFEKDGLITIRNLLKWCERKFICKQKFAMEGYAILAEKLRNEQEKRFVEKVLLSNIKYSLANVRQEYFSVVAEEFSEQKIAQTSIYVQMNDSFKRMAALTIKAIANNEPVLLVGETGCGKTTLAELLAALTHRKFFSINCHKHMEASDLLGSLRPSLNPTSNSKFEFVNGVVIDAMLQGGILLIDEINTAEDSVLERLNQVLECGVVGIERGEGWETVQARPGFCIIATMNPSGDYGKKELSPALRNRFTEIWAQPITHPEYIREAKDDIVKMIDHKLAFPIETRSILSGKIYEFLTNYNCEVAPRYNLTRRLLTMRDIGWICKFMNDSGFAWEQGYFWSIIILAVEGVKYIMTDNIEGGKLESMKDELLRYLMAQVEVQREWVDRTRPEYIIPLIKNMNFPLLLKINTPLEVVGIVPDETIFFSPQTDLSDLLGQYRPQGNDFIWRDEALLRCVKNGGVVALVDLNMAQQQVIEGINSLFDHRGSLFVVELNQTFHKAPSFKPIVVLSSDTGHGRKGLPNSFLNRFVKLSIPHITEDVKLAYLYRAYPHLQNDQKLVQLIKVLLEKETELPIESIEFIIQFSHNGLLNESLQILKLDAYRQDDAVSRFSVYQNEILELLPLKRSLQMNSEALIKALVQSYLVYKYSKFNLCVVGSSKVRANLSKALSYLLRTNYVKILISTMIDINDLLGTYEQVSASQQMEVEDTIETAIACDETGRDFQSEETKFVFVESQVIQCLREQSNLVFVEVPNDSIAERIEKGLKDVYSLTRKIIIGVETLNKKSTLTKFITIDLSQTPLESKDTSSTYASFPQNQSNLTASDLPIRQEETQAFIVEAMNEENGIKSMTAWRRLLECVLLKTHREEERLKGEIEERLRREYLQKYRVSYVADVQVEARTACVLRRVQGSASREALLSKTMLRCFFTSDPLVLSKMLSFFNADEEQLSAVIRKFQIVYSCNVGNFRESARAVMGVLFREKVDSPMIRRYFGEIERLHEELFRHKIKETLVQYNEEEYKLIPILNGVEAVRYQLYCERAVVRGLCDEGTHLDHVFTGLEKVVAENIRLIEVDVPSLGRWCRELRIKHIGALDLFQASIRSRSSLFTSILESGLVREFLGDIGLALPTPGASTADYWAGVFAAFKPSRDMSVNVSYHLKNEMRARFIAELIADDEEFVKKYGVLSEIKYFRYRPSQLKVLAQKLALHSSELKEVQKLLIYRGHNNIESLIDFYQRLITYTAELESSNFSRPLIRKVILETFHGDYHVYADVLLPFYLPLIGLYQQEERRSGSLAAGVLEQAREDVTGLVEALVRREEGEVDRSKDYLRFQKKFNRTVIVDEYTEEGVEKNKAMLEEEFAQLFGKGMQNEHARVESPFDKIHLLIHKTPQGYYPYLSKQLLAHARTYEELVVGLQALLKYEQKAINIYEEYHPALVEALVQPLPALMQQIHDLLARYPIDNIKNLATICGKIQERSLFDEIYKILIDCEFLVEKVFEVNAILPLASHIATDRLVQNCLRVRRLELANWRQMMDLKIRRTEKSDMVEFVDLFKNVRDIRNEHELFALCERFLRESKLSCLPSRIRLLLFLEERGLIAGGPGYGHVLHRVIGFFEYLLPEVRRTGEAGRKAKEAEMREYEKLAGWSSNEYLIFKATCEKFQRKIHHILRRYDEELSLTVGTFHQQLLEKQIFPTVKEFADGLAAILDITLPVADQEVEEEGEGQGAVEQPEKMAQQEGEQEKAQSGALQEEDEYEQVIRRVFVSLRELQAQHHNNQSKLLIIRAYLSELEQTFSAFPVSSKQEYKYLTRSMFAGEEQYARAVKYYYGLWDKLCQRAETSWNREVIDKVWHIAEKIWSHLNRELTHASLPQRDQMREDLTVLFSPFVHSDKQFHPVFAAELDYVRAYLAHGTADNAYAAPGHSLPTSLVSLMKLGYILGNIAVNLQRNGLCAREEEEAGEGSGEEEIGEGVGIGEGEAHEGAENVGDQIEYEEQVLGHKDEERNEDDNAEEKQENDIEMEADFEGQMYSKEEEEGEGESKSGQEKEPDEQMGDVEQSQQEQDMKNEAGEAEGEGQADVDIKDQQDGEEELVDNERENKEERRGEDKRAEDEQGEEGEEEKSDWDSNNQEGEKINKQKEDVEANEHSDSQFDIDQPDDPEELDSQQNSKGEGEEQEQEEAMDEEDSQEGNKDGEQQSLENSEQENENGEEQNGEEQKERRGRQSKQSGPAYGRRDINTNNDVLNDEEQPAEEANNEGNKQQGEGDGNQSSGNPVHNLSPDFIEEILRQQRAEGNEQFLKDLNVLMNDQNEPAHEEEGAEQFELTEQKDKFATNLPLLDDHKMPDEKEERQEEGQKKEEREREQHSESKAKKEEKESQQGRKGEKQKQQKNKNSENANKKAYAEQEYERIKREEKQLPKSQDPIEKETPVDDQQKQKMIKLALQGMRGEEVEEVQGQSNKALLSEAFEVSKILEEQLKSVLEPMDNAEYRGDFRTGKKLNLKKIIPFIASNYRKDRIWLRRTEPSERNYYVMVGLDDTKSMHYGAVGEEALKGTLAISMALEHLAIRTSICAIRDQMALLKRFDDPLRSEAIAGRFQFRYESSNSHDLSMAAFMGGSLAEFARVEEGEAGVEVRKLCFIVSDGKMNKALVQPFMREARRQDVTYVFIIVDSQHSSILNIKSVQYSDSRKMSIKNYMADFPFEYFLIINDVRELGEILAVTLMQFIQEK